MRPGQLDASASAAEALAPFTKESLGLSELAENEMTGQRVSDEEKNVLKSV